MNVKPGDLARVICTALGPNGAAVGCIVRVLPDPSEIPYSIPHTLHGKMWRCALVKGANQLVTEYGGVGNEADFADDWLVRIDPEELTKDQSEKKEITA